MRFETNLAKGHWPRVKQRDRDLTYNKMSVSKLAKSSPGIDWSAMLSEVGLGGQTQVIVREKSAVKKASKVFAETPVEVLKDYLTVSLMNSHSAYLPKHIDDAQFDFYGKTLRGPRLDGR